MEAVRSSETSMNYGITMCHILEDSVLLSLCLLENTYTVVPQNSNH
jgi:hypothetical protein